MHTSLQARIYDPLWLLARQWQLGEFQAEDNGSPIVARWRAGVARLTRYHPGALAPNTMVNAARYDATAPLETVVERETVRPATGGAERLRLAAEAGQHFLRMLGVQPMSADYRAAFIRQYAFPTLTDRQRASFDVKTIAFCDVMANRVPDGRKLYVAFQATSADEIVIIPELQIAPGDVAEVQKAAWRFGRWYQTLFSEPQPGLAETWIPERMEHAFSVGSRLSDGERVLTAQEYTGGRLDWYDFEANPEVTLGGVSDGAIASITRTCVPAPVSFRGMSATRFWELEDAAVNLDAVEAAPTDLVRMLLVEFALAYGNDWFVLPIEVDVGSLCETYSLVITDTFGVRTLIQPKTHSKWRMFQLSYTRSSAITVPQSNTFFLPPALAKSIDGKPLEEVLFLKDEMANVAWAVERRVESPTGAPLDRYEQYVAGQRHVDGAPPPAPGTLRYHLASEVPDYWIPLLPVRVGDGLRLQRGAVLKLDGSPAVVTSRGRILESGQALSILEEEVPREGIRVTRRYQLARWIDGSTHVWIGRDKQVGGGEGSSGLRFDSLARGPR